MDDAAPAWAHEPLELHDPDPGWARLAATEGAHLTDTLRPWLAAEIEHIGSTAIPELPAKPIVDLMALVTDPALVVAWAGDALAAAGWHYVPPELDRRDWRRFHVKADATGQRRVAHLHVIQVGEPRWRQQLEFRDVLRNRPELVARYAELKRELVRRCAGDREAYTEGKSGFVAEVLALG